MFSTKHMSCLVIAALLLSLNLALVRGFPEETRKIRVNGICTMSFRPDRLRVILGVEINGKDASKVFSEALARIDSIQKAILKTGVPNADISVYHLSLVPQYNYEVTPPELVGYVASLLLKIETKNLNIVGKLLEQAVKAGANVVTEVSFFLSDEGFREAYIATLRCAVDDAYRKATTVLGSMNLKLGKPIVVNVEVTKMYPERIPLKMAEATLTPSEVSIKAIVEVEYEVISG